MIQNQARTAAPHKTQAGPNSPGLSQFLRKILQIVFNPRCIPFLTLSIVDIELNMRLKTAKMLSTHYSL